MNVELPPFKNGKYNSESAFTIDRVITSLMTGFYRNSSVISMHQRFLRIIAPPAFAPVPIEFELSWVSSFTTDKDLRLFLSAGLVDALVEIAVVPARLRQT